MTVWQDFDAQDGLPDAIWFSPRDGDLDACLSIEVVGGQKKYLRLWLGGARSAGPAWEWGWTLHHAAVCLWRQETCQPGQPAPCGDYHNAGQCLKR